MSNKPKVLFIGSFLGGAEISFGGQNHACKLLMDSDAWAGFDWVLIDSTQVINPPPSLFLRLYAFLKRCFLIFKAMLFTELDGVLAFSGSGLGLLEKSMYLGFYRLVKRKPTFLFYRGSGLLTNNKMFIWLYKMSLFFPNYIFVQSNYWQNVMLEHFDRKKLSVFVINNWVKIESDKPQSSRSEKTKIKILFTGWVHELKGIFDLVRCSQKLQILGLPVQFIIAGTGKDLNKMKQLAHSLGVQDMFSFIGWVSRREVSDLLDTCNIFVLPSYGEGMPNSLLEAMSRKIACVASNVGSIAEIIDDGENGMIFRAGAVSELEDILIFLSQNAVYRNELGENAYQKMISHYELNLNCSKFLNILHDKVNL